MKTVKYVLCPGWIASSNDGQRHYVSEWHLARLYGVDIAACVVHRPDERYDAFPKEWPRLRPSYLGDYKAAPPLPAAEQQAAE